jgi:predicted dehydrogenase
MKEDKLKTVILGLNENGQILLEAARSSNYLQIEAVADTDSSLAQKAAAEIGCPAFTIIDN